jgi:hypothetical protein
MTAQDVLSLTIGLELLLLGGAIMLAAWRNGRANESGARRRRRMALERGCRC